jgi:uncharacterized protein YbjQ (UPF0145 family)
MRYTGNPPFRPRLKFSMSRAKREQVRWICPFRRVLPITLARKGDLPMTMPARPMMSMPVTTTFTIEGYRIVQYLGLVRGIIVRAPTISQGILGGLKSIIGGQIGAYTQMCEQARQNAYDLLIDHARALGANAIVGLRYDASEIGSKASGATEVLCYGTAVIIEPERG